MNIFQILAEKADEKINDLREALSDCCAKDYAEYREICGTIKGLRGIRLYVKELEQNLEEE